LKIKIFIAHHKDSTILKTNYLIPIQVGAANADLKLDMIGDNSGENISEKNPMFCELTAQYWAWKNCDADFYGLMHYRRHFIFSEQFYPDDWSKMVHFDKIDHNYIQSCGLNDITIERYLREYDCILPNMVNVKDFSYSNNRKQYAEIPYQHLENFDITINILKELYPDYAAEAEEFVNSSLAYWFNMYIFKKELFFKYNEWLFPILFEVEKRIDFKYYSIDEIRFLGFLAERLFSIFLMKLKRESDIKIKHLQITFLEDTNKSQNLFPFFREKNIPIVTASDNKYIPYVGTMITSLIQNSSKEYNYDLIIISKEDEISEFNKELINSITKKYSNIKIRFFNITPFINNIKLFTPRYFQIETYYRLFIPLIFPNFEKVIYLDGDIIVNDDISQLFTIEISGYLIGAVRDSIVTGAMLSPIFNLREYFQNEHKLKNPYNYFQAGVMIMNLNEFRNQNIGLNMIEYANSHNCYLVDQDVLNLFCEEKVKFIEQKWNLECHSIACEVAKSAPLEIYKEFLDARKNPKIFHYAGENKPWNSINLEYSEFFWEYARQTPWYELILHNFIKSTTQDSRIFKISGKEKLILLFKSYIGKVIFILRKVFPEGTIRKKKVLKVFIPIERKFPFLSSIFPK